MNQPQVSIENIATRKIITNYLYELKNINEKRNIPNQEYEVYTQKLETIIEE